MILPKERMDAACGTLSYVAPEVLTFSLFLQEYLFSFSIISTFELIDHFEESVFLTLTISFEMFLTSIA